MVDIFKEIIPSIQQTKKNLSNSEGFTSSYLPFIVNRSLSFHYDCIMQVNEMNKYPGLDNKMQYDYLFNSIRGYKRKFEPWQKISKNENLELVKEYFGYSNEKAKDALSLLTEEQINQIRGNLNKGGVAKGK
jgi:Bacteriophage clamp loader A subunit